MEDLVLESTTKNTEAGAARPDVFRLAHLVVNSYLVGQPGSKEWVLVDGGLNKWSGRKILRAVSERFGPGARPTAIILTHGHFDHVGAVGELAKLWNVPIYAHLLELPYLTGRSSYPPGDPTVGGGMMARMAKFYPRKPINLGYRVGALPSDDSVPGMPGWRWLHTPGHSPGHISLFRESDRTLIAGDAFVTVKQESAIALLTQRQQVSRPPAYFTPDWAAARHSVRVLAKLEPKWAGTGHGLPMHGILLLQQLQDLARNFGGAIPSHGRYVVHPAMADERGVLSLPPAAPDPWPKVIGVGVAALVTCMVISHFFCRQKANAEA